MKSNSQKWLTNLFTGLLILTLALSDSGEALARTGGRIGGGSFRSSPSSPSRNYSPPAGGGYRSPSPGGGIGIPFLLPFFGFGGGFGSLFTILVFLALVNFAVNTLRNVSNSGGVSTARNQISLAQLQVGLLASARDLQPELDQIAREADTDSGMGRSQVLQEVSLALLRHPEYWVYGASSSETTNWQNAETRFNQLSLSQRSKFTEETLSNVNNQLRTTTPVGKNSQDTGEYIIVTILAATEDKLSLPDVNGESNMRQALQTIGGLASDRLIAIEVLWTPQAPGDILTKDDIIAEYPNLKLI